MNIAENLTRIIDAKEAIRSAIIEKGVEVPDGELIDTYHNYIDQISNSPDPDNPTLENLKLALDQGKASEIYPINTEIPDKHGAVSALWVVAHYGTATLANGNTIDGVYLFRSLIQESRPIGNSSDYSTSVINSYLQGDYLTACSESFKRVVSEISVPFYLNASTYKPALAKIFLMSATELAGTSNFIEGSVWSVWAKRGGGSGATNLNNGRIMRDSTGTAQYYWTRTVGNGGTICVRTDGYTTLSTVNSPGVSYGIVPACFIARSEV